MMMMVVVVVYAMVSCAKLVSLVTGPLVAQLAPACLAWPGWPCWSSSLQSVVVTLSRRPGDLSDSRAIITG